ncbi:helix-turn-helix domain containing protein [Sulfitobacter sp. F26169L]|uniref:helix-turn-helix domain-containing protein n=1 Tax=Sulfitobacter sp. F26169L TaxID=2996015 RepID=UPI002260A9B2|nr:helix-turn-helix domain-containing protein [Sulfitobacter sp. F26169L]MCX7567915.1 helix-turn-helix domain containing protein [Sulfitobacter sp. F26169L]
MKLFAERGVENVTIRDIQVAAGQRNNGSITYHFASRDALIRELVQDVGKILDDANNARLDNLEATGEPLSVRDVTAILIPSLSQDADGLAPEDAYSIRFFASVMLTHRELLFEATAGQDRGTRRCFGAIRRLAPDMPPQILQQRLMLTLFFAVSAAASMEAAAQNRHIWQNLWGQASSRSNLADTMAGIILAPVSEETLALATSPQANPSSL